MTETIASGPDGSITQGHLHAQFRGQVPPNALELSAALFGMERDELVRAYELWHDQLRTFVRTSLAADEGS